MTRLHASNDFPAWELLDRYQAGDATPEERAVIDAYLAAHPVTASALSVVTQMLHRSLAAPRSVAVMLAAAHERIVRRTSLRQRAGMFPAGRLEHAVAALLDTADTRLTVDEVEELRRLIDSAKRAGR